MSSLLNEEMIALEWFWNSKPKEEKHQKPKPKRIISKADYPKKAIAEINKVLNTPKYKEVKKYVKLKLDFGNYRDFVDNENEYYCYIGSYRIPNFHSQDVWQDTNDLIHDALADAWENLKDESYSIDADEHAIGILAAYDYEE